MSDEPRDPDDEAQWSFFSFRRIGPPDDPYLRRLTIVQTPWFSLKLHRIYRPDWQRDLHDHPWWFVAFLLWGWYEEEIPTDVRCTMPNRCLQRRNPRAHHRFTAARRWFNVKPALGRHAISRLSRSPVWTLVLTGPRVRTWGFWTDGGTKFIPWDVYIREYRDA